ncbi:TRAP transporter substrate-binding protein [Caldibacillus thermolactis]|jgi:TRAP-type transport system periplasmic protein|uniref:TRAP transporter substrate-binding protein n=1 Tax=Pallidibacillus thermolactis TaxID=251051 RepID=A0ABT2WGA6_9BACI|nr:TRAP transporter substrate-binding protein [Pallidibacillus thermolactis]MCU9594506.1 TRAP transporter substrate-binding protein [Pallidibacillus thermolactis]
MKKKISKNLVQFIFLTIFLILLTGCSISSTALNSNKKEFKIAHVTQETHIWHQASVKFGEELEKLSEGRFTVNLYPSSQLGQEKDYMLLLETGALDAAILTNGYMSTREESLNAWFLPFTFPTIEEAIAMTETEESQALLETLNKQGVKGLGFIFAGNRHILLSDDFVHSPDDLDGKKVRILGSPIMQMFWEHLGAGPTAMPLSEVYTALQTGVIDGMDIDLDALMTEKYYETADHLTITNHMTFPALFVISKRVYNELSKTDQAIVDEAAKRAIAWANEETIKRETETLKKLKDAGVNVTEIEDFSPFLDAKEHVINTYTKKNELIKRFVEKANQLRGEKVEYNKGT